jgi:hypothetical protein
MEWRCVFLVSLAVAAGAHLGGAVDVAAPMDYVNGMGDVLTSPMYAQVANLRSMAISSFLGLPAGSVEVDENGRRHSDDDDTSEDTLDHAPETLQESMGESAGTSAAKKANKASPPKKKAAKVPPKSKPKKVQHKKKNQKKKKKAKNAMRPKKRRPRRERRQHHNRRRPRRSMPSPPPRRGVGLVPHIKLGRVEFSTEKVNGNTLHATMSLTGRNIKGQTLRIQGATHISGALHLRGKGMHIKSKVNSKSLRATVFVNKKNVKGCGIAVSDEGGFFDHNDGFITYEPLSGKKGFKVNAPLLSTGPLYADGTLHLGGKGGTRKSKMTGRTVHALIHTNRHMAEGGGFAVSDSGGFFDFKDGFITYEPLSGAKGLLVNSKLGVQGKADFRNDVEIKGSLNVKGDINMGGVKMMSFGKAFSGFHKKHDKLDDRVKELETRNAALTERLMKMEAMMQAVMSQTSK